MTKLPAKRQQIQQFIKYLDGCDQPRHPFLPIKRLRWFKIRDRDMFGAEGYFVDRYLVARRPAPNNIYWSAGINLSTQHIVLGEEFLTKYEAMEICEAWEYARVYAHEAQEKKDVKKLGTKQIT